MIHTLFPEPYLLFLGMITGTVSAYIALRVNRNPYIWFCVGALFGLLGCFFIFFLPSFRKKPSSVQPIKATPTLQGPKHLTWYYVDGLGQQKGPLSFQAIKKEWEENRIFLDTYVWHEELSEWTLLQKLIQ